MNEYSKMQFEISKMYAMYWHAMAITGAAVNRDISRGGVQLTADEKTQEVLDTMNRHIQNMAKLIE